MVDVAAREARAAQVAQDFALLLETACAEFECLQRLVTGEVQVQAADQFGALRAGATIRMALAKAFLFNAARAYRICRHGKGLLKRPRELRGAFLQALEVVVAVRDVNEHGFDAHEVAGKRNDRPTAHLHVNASALVDETSLMIKGPQQILMGPLNLFDLYGVVRRMTDLAGFHALPMIVSAPPTNGIIPWPPDPNAPPVPRLGCARRSRQRHLLLRPLPFASARRSRHLPKRSTFAFLPRTRLLPGAYCRKVDEHWGQSGCRAVRRWPRLSPLS